MEKLNVLNKKLATSEFWAAIQTLACVLSQRQIFFAGLSLASIQTDPTTQVDRPKTNWNMGFQNPPHSLKMEKQNMD